MAGLGSPPFSHLGEERTRPSALWLLLPLLITALIGGGVWAWLQRGLPPKPVEPPPLAVSLPAVRLPAPIPTTLANPEPEYLVPLVRPKRKVPPRVSAPGPRRAAPPPRPVKLKATLRLEGGGDPRGIEVRVSSPKWELTALHPDAEGNFSVEVPRREAYSLLATAPGYAFATGWVNLERTPDEEPVIFLERLKQYQLDVVELEREPDELEVAAPGASDHPQSLRVEAGQIWRDVEFSQREGELYAMGKMCVCIAHSLGPVPAGTLARAAIPPPSQKPARCFFAMRVGEAFAVQPQPGDGWVVLRLREPGVEALTPPSSGRRVVTSTSAQSPP